jgi:hypothetical protein
MAPYPGVGHGNVARLGVNFYFDIGVMLQGSPRVTLTAQCGPSLPAAQCTQFNEDVVAERQKVGDKVNKYKWYPVVNVGITVGF